ncbi:hypothetical protein B0H14DRAFT_3085032 [Mycena olivaceomarginata]|nr:hypothetical protein B0H14DRAFT_3085032 [Mycena olivaceomarginata]
MKTGVDGRWPEQGSAAAAHQINPADPSVRKTAKTLAFTKFKMQVYQHTFLFVKVVFPSLKAHSWNDEPLECWDGLIRVFHPSSFLSMGKNRASTPSYFNACRAALANYPCPKCLMHHSELHCITKKFKVRTTATMKAVVDKASNALTKTEAEAILKNNVLHGIKHFLWGFRFLDPYAAYSYDTLHSDDLGKWGHHLWPLLLDNGQSFFDILKHVSKKYGKDFDFFKQHATSHIVDDIFQKGTTNHGSTRPGEGFQQEVTEEYNQTSFKNIAAQRPIGRIWMAIDKDDRQRKEDEQEDEPDIDETPNESQFNSGSWRLVLTPHQICPFKCAHITYQSLEDWRGLRDIVRCNPSFHGHPRYDSVLFNSDSPDMAFARLHSLLRCTLESKHHTAGARTEWAGCQVREEVPEYSFLLMDYAIRGALLTPVPGNDAVDTDMFLRADQY